MASTTRKLDPITSRASAEPLSAAHLSLADSLNRVGRRDEAIALYKAAVRSDPASRPALLGLARALLSAGRAKDACPHADAAVTLDSTDAEAWMIMGEAMEAMGETELAVSAFERVSNLSPRAGAPLLRLGRIYERLDRPYDATRLYQRILSFNPPAPDLAIEAHVALSQMFKQAAQFTRARAHAESALRLNPNCLPAHEALAAIFQLQGLVAEAEEHHTQAVRAKPATIKPITRRRVLTLASPGRALSPDRYLIPASRYDRLTWFPAKDDAPPPGDYEVIFNAISDPEAAEALIPLLTVFAANDARPLLNPPERIARTAREQAADLFADIADLVVPLTRRIRAPEPILPGSWLLRPANPNEVQRVERLTAAEVDSRLDEKPRLLTAFHDYRSADGLHRKYRVFFIDRQPYPYHMAANEHWLVHYPPSQAPKRPDLIAEEMQFLHDPARHIGPRAWAAVEAIGRRLDLDFAAADFAVLPDGRTLLFEANAMMLPKPEPVDGSLPHKIEYLQRIYTAFWTRLETAPLI